RLKSTLAYQDSKLRQRVRVSIQHAWFEAPQSVVIVEQHLVIQDCTTQHFVAAGVGSKPASQAARSSARQVSVCTPDQRSTVARSVPTQLQHPPLAPYPAHPAGMIHEERRLSPGCAARVREIELLLPETIRHERNLMFLDVVLGQKRQGF